MARKSKRLELNEAIRRGQARIAEGLRTGQMRSDKGAFQEQNGPVELKANSADKGKAEPFNNDFFKSKEISSKFGVWSSGNKATVVIYAGAVVLVGLAIWIILALGSSDQPVSGGDESSRISPEMRADSVVETDVQPELSQTPDTGTEVKFAAETPQGDNVIVIYTIELGRKDILRPVAEFFRSKGIETEIITVSGKAVLVTKAAFEQNPAGRGTDGYELFQRIKQLGPVYVEETQDTKFGQKPFQDAYGYKRQ